jgi:hypothetical protein
MNQEDNGRPSNHFRRGSPPLRSEKDAWDKARMVSMVATPFVAAFVGWLFSSALKTREVEAEYVS